MVEHHKYAAAPNKTNPIVVRNVGEGDLVLGGPVGRLGTATTTPTLTLILTLTSLASTVEVNLILRGNYYYDYYYHYYYHHHYYYYYYYYYYYTLSLTCIYPWHPQGQRPGSSPRGCAPPCPTHKGFGFTKQGPRR